MGPEARLKTAIVKHLRSRGIICWRQGAGPYAPAGLSDIIGCMMDGRFLAIEAKVEGNQLTELQERFLQSLPPGAVTIVAYSLQDVKDIIP
jgi:hypothetical protein